MKGENTKLQSRIHELEQKVTNVRNISGVGRCFVVFFQKGGGGSNSISSHKTCFGKEKNWRTKTRGGSTRNKGGIPLPHSYAAGYYA